MKERITRAFNQMATSYKNNLGIFWPTVGSRGITEANQVHEFCKAFESIDIGSFSYLEVPFGERGRIDGVIIDPTETKPKLILIEAKRIKENGYNKAYESIKGDVKRLIETKVDDDKDGIFDLAERADDSMRRNGIDVYFVYLADVWIGNKRGSFNVIPTWESKSLFNCWRECEMFVSDPVYESGGEKRVEYRLLMAASYWGEISPS